MHVFWSQSRAEHACHMACCASTQLISLLTTPQILKPTTSPWQAAQPCRQIYPTPAVNAVAPSLSLEAARASVYVDPSHPSSVYAMQHRTVPLAVAIAACWLMIASAPADAQQPEQAAAAPANAPPPVSQEAAAAACRHQRCPSPRAPGQCVILAICRQPSGARRSAKPRKRC